MKGKIKLRDPHLWGGEGIKDLELKSRGTMATAKKGRWFFFFLLHSCEGVTREGKGEWFAAGRRFRVTKNQERGNVRVEPQRKKSDDFRRRSKGG